MYARIRNFWCPGKEQVQEVLDSGVLMRYGFDGMRNGHWKAKRPWSKPWPKGCR